MKVQLGINKENFAVCIMVTDVKSETSTSYGNSSKTQMPEIILCNHFQSTVSNQQFRLKMERFEYDTARLNLQDRISQYRSLFERSLEDHTRSNEADLKKQFERNILKEKVAIIKSNLNRELIKLRTKKVVVVALKKRND